MTITRASYVVSVNTFNTRSNLKFSGVLGGLTDTVGKTVGGVTNTVGDTVSGVGKGVGYASIIYDGKHENHQSNARQ